MRLNSVDLTAQFGPMMPSASPRATSSATPSTALSEPNDRARLSSLRITLVVARMSGAISGSLSANPAYRYAHAGYVSDTHRVCYDSGSAMHRFRAASRPGNGRSINADRQAIGSILPPTGISGAVLLS